MAAATDDLLNPTALADYLQVPVATIYQWRHKGYGPRGVRVGRHVRFRRADVDRWLEDQADKPRPGAA